jgi:hypothetical protein
MSKSTDASLYFCLKVPIVNGIYIVSFIFLFFSCVEGKQVPQEINKPEINIQNNEIIEPDPMIQLDKINISNQELIGVWITDEYYFFCFLDNNEYLFECAGWGRAGIWECEDNIIIIKYEDQETEIYDVEYFEDDILIIKNRDNNKFPMEPRQRILRFNREK